MKKEEKKRDRNTFCPRRKSFPYNSETFNSFRFVVAASQRQAEEAELRESERGCWSTSCSRDTVQSPELLIYTRPDCTTDMLFGQVSDAFAAKVFLRTFENHKNIFLSLFLTLKNLKIMSNVYYC